MAKKKATRKKAPRKKAAASPTKKKSDPAPLSPKQMRFVKEYAKDFNQAQAAIRAGYAPNSAKVTASRLLTNANVAEALAEVTKAVMQRADVTTQRLVDEYAKIAFSTVTPADFMVGQLGGGAPGLKPVETWTPEMRLMCVRSDVTDKGVRIELRDRDKALEMLTKYAGGFIDRQERSGAGGAPQQHNHTLVSLTPEQAKSARNFYDSVTLGDDD